MKPAKKKDLPFALVLVLLLAAGFLFYEATQHQSGQTQQSSTQPSFDTEAMVNRHLFYTAQKAELQKEIIQVENSWTAPAVGESLFKDPKPSNKAYGVDHSPDTYEARVVNDLNLNDKQVNYVSPSGVIQRELHERRVVAEYSQRWKEEYVEQFLENARKNGYEVTLDKDYRVVNVREIRRKPNGESIFKGESFGTK